MSTENTAVMSTENTAVMSTENTAVMSTENTAVMSTDRETPQQPTPIPFRAQREIWPSVIAYIQHF